MVIVHDDVTIWYALFGLLALDISVIANELIYSLPYFLISFLAWRFVSKYWLLIAGIGWLSMRFMMFITMSFVNYGVFVVPNRVFGFILQ